VRLPKLSVVDGLGLLQIEDCLDAQGGVALPPSATLISLIDRNIANVGDATAYRCLDYSRAVEVRTDEVSWTQFGAKLQAIGASVQQAAGRGERVAILAPQGIDYVAGFYAARFGIRSPRSSSRLRRPERRSKPF